MRLRGGRFLLLNCPCPLSLFSLTLLMMGSPYSGSKSQVEGGAWPVATAAASEEKGPDGGAAAAVFVSGARRRGKRARRADVRSGVAGMFDESAAAGGRGRTKRPPGRTAGAAGGRIGLTDGWPRARCIREWCVL